MALDSASPFWCCCFIVLASLSIYVSALWFGSLGYSAVYWYIFKLKLGLFLVFFVLTALILRVAFLAVSNEPFGASPLEPRTILINQQPVQILAGDDSFGRWRWIVSIVVGLILRAWDERHVARLRALSAPAADAPRTIRSLASRSASICLRCQFYDAISSWLLYLAVIILVAALAYALLGWTAERFSTELSWSVRRRAFTMSRCVLGAFY